ncbi:MAG: DUF4276 family protein [Bacteroidetes bacterium]|nr:MAG: DUF4276 family protein [Bacteroidota bacterium]
MREEFSSFPRFIPYIQVHEFEALLLCEPSIIHEQFEGYDRPRKADALQREIAGLPPEEINLGDETAPSKRIIKWYPAYADNKAFHGPRIAAKIGLERIRAHNPHFDEWLSRLESLSPGQNP